MGERAEKGSTVPETNAPWPRTVVELANYLNNATTDRPPTLIWSKEAIDDSQASGEGEAAEGDMYANLSALEEAQRTPRTISLTLASLIGLVVVAAGALYHLSKTPSGTELRHEQSSRMRTDKGKQAADEQLLARLEAWMNKGARR